MADALDETGVVVGNGGTVLMVNGELGRKFLVVDNTKLFSTTVIHRHSSASHHQLVSTPGPVGLYLAADSVRLSRRECRLRWCGRC